MDFQEISHDNIAATLLACSNIKIILITESLALFNQYKKFYWNWLHNDILRNYQNEMFFKNGSSLTFLYGNLSDYLRGVRAEIVVIDDEISEKYIQEIAIPLISSSWSSVLNGGPIFATGIYKLKEVK